MQTKAPVFDDLANLMTNAFGAAKGVGDEVKAVARSRADHFIAEMDLVSRDEFEVLKSLLHTANETIAAQNDRIARLEKSLKK